VDDGVEMPPIQRCQLAHVCDIQLLKRETGKELQISESEVFHPDIIRVLISTPTTECPSRTSISLVRAPMNPAAPLIR
jgi:hypothetical protein